jgi:hypothetical protein
VNQSELIKAIIRDAVKSKRGLYVYKEPSGDVMAYYKSRPLARLWISHDQIRAECGDYMSSSQRWFSSTAAITFDVRDPETVSKIGQWLNRLILKRNRAILIKYLVAALLIGGAFGILMLMAYHYHGAAQ